MARKFGRQPDAFYEGWDFCDRGGIKPRNPYVTDPEKYEWWRIGWEARFYNEPRDL